MEKEFIPYEQALALKELGFDEDCFMIYYDGTNELRGSSHFLYSRDIKAPLYQQAFRWFREKYGYDYSIKPVYGEKHYRKYRINVYVNEKLIQVMKYYFPDMPYFDTHEEAELECLKKLIEIVKEENK